jgi:hypothetical protein
MPRKLAFDPLRKRRMIPLAASNVAGEFDDTA